MARRRRGLASLLSAKSWLEIEGEDREAGDDVRECWREEVRLLHRERDVLKLELELEASESIDPRRFRWKFSSSDHSVVGEGEA
jgi:hypothetical protein